MVPPTPSGWRRLIPGGVVVALLVILGLTIAAFKGGPPESPGDDHSPAQDSEVDGNSTDPIGDGVDSSVGTEEPAINAAIEFASASQRWLYLTDQQVAEAVLEISTPAVGDRLADDVVSELAVARESLGASPGRVWWLVRPLATHIEHLDGAEARVSVWVVTVLSAAEVAEPQTEWRTVTLDLQFVSGTWLVDSVFDSPGPTPALGPGDVSWDAVPFDDAMDGFTRLDGETVR